MNAHLAGRRGTIPKSDPSPTGASPMSRYRGLILGAVLAGLIVGYVYWPVLSAQALSFDDSIYLFENSSFRQPGWAAVRQFFGEVLHSPTVEGYYEPLTLTSLMLDVAAGGSQDNLQPFHRTSLALHVANTILIIFLLYSLFGETWPAVMAGLLFGLHPLTVEPVSWVWERKTLLAAFFTLLSLIAYVRYTRHGSYVAYACSLLAFVFSVLAKPTSVPLPAILLLLDWWPLKRLSRRTLLDKVPFFVVAGISAAITIFSTKQNVGITMPSEFEPAHMAGRVCYLIIFYFTKVIWPKNLSSSYPAPASFALSEPQIIVSVVLLTFIVIGAAISLRRTRAAATGFLIFLAAILPMLGIIGYSWVIASDKYVYLPALGLLLALCFLLTILWRNSLVKYRAAVVVCVIFLASAEAVGTRGYLHRWRDTQTLSEYMLKLNPNSPAVLNQLGNVLSAKGRSAEAVDLYQRAIRLEPRLYSAYYNLGLELAQHGRTPEAIKCFQTAVKLKPNFARAHTNLGVLLGTGGEFETAISHLRQALQFDPYSPRTHNNLANILAQQGEVQEAEKHYLEAIRLQPNYAEAYSNFGFLLASQNRTQEAAEHYQTALGIQPRFPKAHNNLALLRMQQGQADVAIRHYLIAIQLWPDYVQARMNLATAYRSQDRLAEAAEQFREVLRIQPGHSQAEAELQQVASRPESR